MPGAIQERRERHRDASQDDEGEGHDLRLLEITNNAAGLSGRSEWNFCKTPAGWKIPS